MEFCSNCGNEITPGSLFCTNCGAKADDNAGGREEYTQTAPDQTAEYTQTVPDQTAEYTQTAPDQTADTYSSYGNNASKKPLSNKTIGMIAVGAAGVAVILLLTLLINLFITPGYEKPIKNYVKAIETGNFMKVFDSFPDYITDSMEDMIDYMYDGDKDEYTDMIKERLKDQFGKRIKVSYNVTRKDRLKKSDIRDLEGQIDNMYDESVRIKDAYNLKVELKIKGSEDEDSRKVRLTIIKIGSKWYLYENSLMGF